MYQYNASSAKKNIRHMSTVSINQSSNQSINPSNYFIVRPKVDQRVGQLTLSHVGITET